MPVATPTLATAAVGDAATSSTVTSGTWTPTQGELLLVFGCSRNTTLSSPTVTTTHSNTTFTVAQTAQVPTANGLVFAWGIVGSTPGSGAVTVNFGASGVRHTLQIVQIASGFRSFGTIGLTASATQTSGTSLGVSLASPARNSDLLIGMIANNGASDITASTGAELSEVSSTGGTPIFANVQYLNGNAGTTLNWSTLNSANTAAILAAVRCTGAKTT